MTEPARMRTLLSRFHRRPARAEVADIYFETFVFDEVVPVLPVPTVPSPTSG